MTGTKAKVQRKTYVTGIHNTLLRSESYYRITGKGKVHRTEKREGLLVTGLIFCCRSGSSRVPELYPCFVHAPPVPSFAVGKGTFFLLKYVASVPLICASNAEQPLNTTLRKRGCEDLPRLSLWGSFDMRHSFMEDPMFRVGKRKEIVWS
jgi:hypothetical protein